MPSIKQKKVISVFDILESSASGRIIFLKLIDHTVGFLSLLVIQGLLLFKPKKVDPNPEKIKNVLIIRPGGIGDAVCILPLLKILKQKTGCFIDVLCERRNKSVFDFCRENIRFIWMYDAHGWNLIKDLARQKYDYVIDSEQYHNFSAIFAFLASSRSRVGFDTVSLRSKLYTHMVSYNHQAQEYKMFLELFNVLVPITDQEYLQQRAIETFESDMFIHQELKEHRYLVLYIGASVIERYWGSEKFARLSEELVRLGYRIALVGGREDIKKAEEIKSYFNNGKMIDLVGKITLAQTLFVLKQALGAIGADSGIMHLACAVDCPSVWLFGAGIEKKWLPQYSKHESINLNLHCSPCTLFGYTPRCPYGVKCLKDINVSQVVDKIKILLKISLIN